MGVDLHKRDASRNRLLLTGQAIVPVLIILTTTVSCSRRAAETPEPPYRIVERILPFSSRLSDEENRQLVQRRSDAKPNLQQEQHGTSSPPKVAKVTCARIRAAHPPPRHAPGKTNPHRYSIRKKSSCFQQFLECGSARRTCVRSRRLRRCYSVKPPYKTPVGGFGFCVMAASVTTTWSLQASPLYRRAASKFKTVPLVTLSNLTELMRRGGRRRKTSCSSRIELPRPLPLNSQPPGKKTKSDLHDLLCVSPGHAGVYRRHFYMSVGPFQKGPLQRLGSTEAVIILGVNSAERSASDRRYWSQLRFTSWNLSTSSE